MTARGAATPLVAALVLLTILIAIYGPGIGKGFVKDDVVWVGANHVTSWTDVRALLFRTDGFYRPVVAATFALDRAAYGLEPFGFGVTNLILLLLGAAALAYLATSLGLRVTTAIAVAGVWTLNFHAVNMAVLWLSGRTALCVAIAALLSAAAVVKKRPIAAGVAALVAMLAKEEAVMLPIILSGWAWVLAEESSESHTARVVRLTWLTWPTWLALAIYLALRAQTAAMTPMTATAPYQFVLAPGALVGNALEYLDRACTFSAIVVIVAHLIAWRRPAITPAITRVLLLAAIWFAGTFALTIFVPNRSSLYALLPSVAPALVTGFLLQQLWDGSRGSSRPKEYQSQPASDRDFPAATTRGPRRARLRAGVGAERPVVIQEGHTTSRAIHRRLVTAGVILPILLLPVYWSRNVRWVEIAELSSETFAAIQRVVRERPDADRLMFRDDRSTRRSFANAYDQLLPEAVRLAAGRDIRAEIDTGQTERSGALQIVLENGRIRVD